MPRDFSCAHLCELPADKFWAMRLDYGFDQHIADYDGQVFNLMWANDLVDDDGNEMPPSSMDLTMHFLTIFWKVLYAFIPPPEFMGGWLCFTVAIIFIGVTTFVVGELAGLFGCAVGLKKATTAITFVALGTSLPDMFASKLAAQQEDTADNAVGNVTGSNGVNVFLGIGLPWTIAALYGKGIGEPFIARSNGFGLMVVVFVLCALIFIAMLAIRRSKFGGELGGPKKSANFHAGIGYTLWFAYVLVSAMRQYENIGDLWAVKSQAPPLEAVAHWVEKFGYTCGVWGSK